MPKNKTPHKGKKKREKKLGDNSTPVLDAPSDSGLPGQNKVTFAPDGSTTADVGGQNGKNNANNNLALLPSLPGDSSPPQQKVTPSWSRDEAAAAMMGGIGQTLEEQNNANAVVWYNTMFSGNKILKNPDSDQERVLQEQQDFLKRHFLAMAVLGLQGGNQTTGEYVPLEKFQNEQGMRVNLATVSSGGGRLNYRSTDGAGDDFKDFLFFGNKKSAKSMEQLIKEQPIAPLGAYERISTHQESFNGSKIMEGSSKTGQPAIGLSIPIGGVGQKLQDAEGNEVITGYQGKSNAGTENYQTGAGLIRHRTEGQLSSTMVAFEGSAPGENNIFGGSHGRWATFKKVVLKHQSEYTLTGQGKRSTWDLYRPDVVDQKIEERRQALAETAAKSAQSSPRRAQRAVQQIKAKEQNLAAVVEREVKREFDLRANGSIKVDVTQDSLAYLKQVWAAVESMDPQEQQKLYQDLLLTTTQQERDDLLADIIPRKKDGATPVNPDGTSTRNKNGADGTPSPSPDRVQSEEESSAENASQTEPVIDDKGVLLDKVRESFRQAYRADIRKGAYLTEGEGDIIAKELGLSLNIYTQVPPGFKVKENPGNGDCLLYSLLQAKNLLNGNLQDTDTLEALIQGNMYRDTIADKMTDEAIDALVDAALNGAIAGVPEPGLGSNMTALLNHPSIIQYRLKQGTVGKEGMSSAARSSSKASSPSDADSGRVVTIGDNSKPALTGVALYHSGGNHYRMIYKDG